MLAYRCSSRKNKKNMAVTYAVTSELSICKTSTNSSSHFCRRPRVLVSTGLNGGVHYRTGFEQCLARITCSSSSSRTAGRHRHRTCNAVEMWTPSTCSVVDFGCRNRPGVPWLNFDCPKKCSHSHIPIDQLTLHIACTGQEEEGLLYYAGRQKKW